MLFLMDELGKLLVLDIEMLLWGICALSYVQPVGFSILVLTDSLTWCRQGSEQSDPVWRQTYLWSCPCFEPDDDVKRRWQAWTRWPPGAPSNLNYCKGMQFCFPCTVSHLDLVRNRDWYVWAVCGWCKYPRACLQTIKVNSCDVCDVIWPGRNRKGVDDI